jgi:hypothetical protein
MSKLDSSQKVLGLARSLGLRGDDGAVAQITRYCTSRIHELSRGEHVESLADLERVVCEKLNLVIEEIESDDDIAKLVQKYAVGDKDPAIASIRTHFDSDIFGTTFLRRKHHSGDPDRYVAFIDCRGTKGNRRYFTRWHEIAHLLIQPPRSGQPVNRAPIKNSPLEQVMDIIAGTVGFFEPIFKGAVEVVVATRGFLGFTEIESLRQCHCPRASFQSTLIAAVRHASSPAIYLEAEMGHKKAEKEKLRPDQPLLFDADVPEAKLRLTRVTANDAARLRRLRFDKHMEVPADSIVYKLFHRSFGGLVIPPSAAVENLSTWRHSDGSTLGSADVVVEARRLPELVYALVRPQQ